VLKNSNDAANLLTRPLSLEVPLLSVSGSSQIFSAPKPQKRHCNNCNVELRSKFYRFNCKRCLAYLTTVGGIEVSSELSQYKSAGVHRG
jgi:hypothetical protein